MEPTDDFGRLLEHSRWVRALGVRLAGASEGEDVAQEAWLVAMARGDGVRAPAAWLRGVVRKLAGEQRRGAERRACREAAAAVPEGVPGPDELVAEAELSRELLRAVTELDEPFRSTVLLRYSRGLEPDEIARQQGVPAATVRTRLHRAHEKLRARLDRTHGGRAAWALAFVGPGTLEVATGATSWTAGGLMGAKGVAAALAIGVGVAVWLRSGGGGGERVAGAAVADRAHGGEDVTKELTAVANSAAASPSVREILPDVLTSEPAFEDLLLYGSVLDTAGTPVELEWVGFQDEHGREQGRSWNSWQPGIGSYSLAGIRPGRLTLTVRAVGYLHHVEELRLVGDREDVRHDVVLERGLAIPVRVLDEHGEKLAHLDPERGYELDLLLTRAGVPVGDSGERASASRMLGAVTWARHESIKGLPPGCSGLLRLVARPPVEVHACFENFVFTSERIEGPMDELVLRIDRSQLAEGLGTVRARFVDAISGDPLVDGKAGIDWGNRYTSGGTALDGDGSAEFTQVPAGRQRLRFFHQNYEDFTRPISIPVGGVLELGDVRVWPCARVRGRLIGPDGKAVVGSVSCASEEFLATATDLRDVSSHAAWGHRFDLFRAPRTRLRLFARSPGLAPASFVIDASGGDVEGLELRLEAGVPVSLRGVGGRTLRLLDAAGRPSFGWAGGELRLLRGHHVLELGSGAAAKRVEFEVGDEPLVVELPEAD